MNYIKRLQLELAVARRENREMRFGILALRAYLCSGKFWKEDSVNVRDVLSRLQQLVWRADDVEATLAEEAQQ